MSVLGDLYTDTLPDLPEVSLRQVLEWEKEYIGLYLTYDPLKNHASKWSDFKTVSSSDIEASNLDSEEEIDDSIPDGETVLMFGSIESVKIINTKKGSTMCRISARDLAGKFECVVFPREYMAYKSIINKDNMVYIKGKVDTFNSKRNVKLNKMMFVCKLIDGDEMDLPLDDALKILKGDNDNGI